MEPHTYLREIDRGSYSVFVTQCAYTSKRCFATIQDALMAQKLPPLDREEGIEAYICKCGYAHNGHQKKRKN